MLQIQLFPVGCTIWRVNLTNYHRHLNNDASLLIFKTTLMPAEAVGIKNCTISLSLFGDKPARSPRYSCTKGRSVPPTPGIPPAGVSSGPTPDPAVETAPRVEPSVLWIYPGDYDETITAMRVSEEVLCSVTLPRPAIVSTPASDPPSYLSAKLAQSKTHEVEGKRIVRAYQSRLRGTWQISQNCVTNGGLRSTYYSFAVIDATERFSVKYRVEASAGLHPASILHRYSTRTHHLQLVGEIGGAELNIPGHEMITLDRSKLEDLQATLP